MSIHSPSTRSVFAGAAMLGTALSLATPEIMRWEGKHNDPYRDMVGVLTVCYGDTHAPMRHYSDAQCSAMLEARVERDYARPILRCVPGLAKNPHIFAASISLAYNIGTGAFCRSTSARRFNAGDWAGGCDAIAGWNRAGGQVVQGLVRRRDAERRLCRQGAGMK